MQTNIKKKKKLEKKKKITCDFFRPILLSQRLVT